MDEGTEEKLENPLVLVTLVVGAFAALYAGLWLAYLVGPLFKRFLW